MQLTSKVEYEFNLKLNLSEAQSLLGILATDGGYQSVLSEVYDALMVEFTNLKVDPF